MMRWDDSPVCIKCESLNIHFDPSDDKWHCNNCGEIFDQPEDTFSIRRSSFYEVFDVDDDR